MKKIKYIAEWRWTTEGHWRENSEMYYRYSKTKIEELLHEWKETHGDELQVRCREEECDTKA